MKRVARTVVALVGVLAVTACGGGRAETPAAMWTEAQAESIRSVRGLPVRVRHCDGLGAALEAGGKQYYARFACLAGARASFQAYDTVAVTYVLRPLGRYTGRSSRHALAEVRFAALQVP